MAGNIYNLEDRFKEIEREIKVVKFSLFRIYLCIIGLAIVSIYLLNQ